MDDDFNLGLPLALVGFMSCLLGALVSSLGAGRDGSALAVGFPGSVAAHAHHLAHAMSAGASPAASIWSDLLVLILLPGGAALAAIGALGMMAEVLLGRRS